MVRFCIIILAAAMFTACSGRPGKVLGKEDMAQLMADINLAESVVENNQKNFPNDSTKQAFLQSIYAKHEVTSEEVDSSLSWYGYHIEKYLEVYDRTIEILEDRLTKQEELAGASVDGVQEITGEMEGDSVDVWPGIRFRRFSASMPSDNITFNLSNDRNWESGDVYTLRSKIMDNRGPLRYTIAVDYSDGKREYLSKSLSGDGWHEMRFVLDSAKIAQRVYGTITYESLRGEIVYIDSISLFRTRWGGHYRDQRNEIQSFENRTLQSSQLRKELTEKPIELPAAARLTPEQANPRNKGLLMLDMNNSSKQVPVNRQALPAKGPVRPGRPSSQR